MDLLEKLKQESYEAAMEVMDTAKLAKGNLFVVGCSTSEVLGAKIGTTSSPEAAAAVFGGIYHAVREREIYLAAQCCEHLNRVLIIEETAAEKFGYEPVNVIPQPKAGGSFATQAWKSFSKPVAVEHIRAHAGMDIGDTFIGMHLREVAVPVRISIKQIGEAHLTCARTRAKFVGGSRAIYDEDKSYSPLSVSTNIC